jgi:hypothetical protein
MLEYIDLTCKLAELRTTVRVRDSHPHPRTGQEPTNRKGHELNLRGIGHFFSGWDSSVVWRGVDTVQPTSCTHLLLAVHYVTKSLALARASMQNFHIASHPLKRVKMVSKLQNNFVSNAVECSCSLKYF